MDLVNRRGHTALGFTIEPKKWIVSSTRVSPEQTRLLSQESGSYPLENVYKHDNETANGTIDGSDSDSGSEDFDWAASRGGVGSK